ncbi:AraC family transcriptional regulator [Thalassobacillus sp. CUG 92003]|uniref:AraC family transcriptional regulator n=1 Tax=Thalassobacillus sp. CUG 92003 TaxID=2736641 RepID=UPI0015E77F5A|nr:AraC family transcriptional regulator [Thalassobacillus sp. CUG 92003]
MDSLSGMNRALAYIEEHLAWEIDIKKAAELALCSEYHFKRMFSTLAGVTMSEYIRLRRLTLAGLELKNENTRVIDLALKYGYTSPDAFTRAFHHVHGITPTEARHSNHSLKAYPPMSFQLTVKGGQEMNYRIEEKEAFRIVGLKKRIPLIYQGMNPDIVALWKSVDADTKQQLEQLSNVTPRGLLNVSANFSEDRSEQGELDYYIGIATTHAAPADMAELEVPALQWAVFELEGPYPETIQNAWARIFSEWLPSSGYELVEGPEILWNEDNYPESTTLKSELWIPVTKK